MLSTLFTLWMASATPLAPAHYLDRPGGRIAYTDSGGTGRPVVCVPGIGEVRATWRFITPLLIDAGYRVIALDIRGQGESSVGFSSYAPEATGDDVVALMESLNLQGAIVMGNSFGGAAAVWAAAERPNRVAGLMLVDPFVRDFPVGFWLRTTMHALFMRPWGPSAWGSYYKSLYKQNKPSDLEPYVDALVANLREPERIEAVRAMIDVSKSACEKRLAEVHVPVAVIMGTADSDFDDPAGEAQHVAKSVQQGHVVMVQGSGHYPQVEQPGVVLRALKDVAAP